MLQTEKGLQISVCVCVDTSNRVMLQSSVYGDASNRVMFTK